MSAAKRLERLEETVRRVCLELRMDELGPANPPRSREAVRFLEGSLSSRPVPRFNTEDKVLACIALGSLAGIALTWWLS